MDAEIYELLKKTYNCRRVKKLGTHQEQFIVERKEKINKKKKIMWLIPINEYSTWKETLSDWDYQILRMRNFTGRIVKDNIHIAICFDEVSDTCYWRYVI